MESYSSRKSAKSTRTQPTTQRCGHRFSVREDHGKRGPCGYDGGKKIKGRKRHIATDTQGLILKVKVHRASLQDRVGIQGLVNPRFAISFSSVKEVLVDIGYQGQGLRHIESTLKVKTTGAQHLWKRRRTFYFLPLLGLSEKPTGFQVLPRRWVVERTFA